MRLHLNGSEREVEQAVSVQELVDRLGLHRMIVVEHNGVILTREQYASTALREGDRLEIVHLVGGG